MLGRLDVRMADRRNWLWIMSNGRLLYLL